jgi:hypothetical protein
MEMAQDANHNYYNHYLYPQLKAHENSKSTTHHPLQHLFRQPTKALTTEDIKTVWTYCWVDKAQQKTTYTLQRPLANTQSHLLHYGTKEAQFGNTKLLGL